MLKLVSDGAFANKRMVPLGPVRNKPSNSVVIHKICDVQLDHQTAEYFMLLTTYNSCFLEFESGVGIVWLGMA